MRIDAHQHFWRLSRGDYGWLRPGLGGIYRDFGPDDLQPLMLRAGVARTVLVQAAASEAETAFLLEIAAAEPFVAGVVGWTDLEAADAADRIAIAARDPRLLGLRPMMQDLPDDAWMLRPELTAPLEAMTRLGLCFDALVKPRHLPVLRRFLARYPDLRVVIDHGAKPDIAGGRFAEWAAGMRAIALESAAACKLSGLVTEAAAGWRADDLRPYVDVLLESFGPGRLMWGSDWPVLNLNGAYDTWAGASADLLAGLADNARALVFGGTARAFYGIEP